MSAHLLQISAERLATLPSGVLVDVVGERYRSTHDGWLMHPEHEQKRVSWLCAPLHLVLDDTVTAAVAASCIVWPWLSADRERRAAHRDVEHVIRAAERMQPLTPADLDILARLARAAMEGA